jgi:hypothetical protein
MSQFEAQTQKTLTLEVSQVVIGFEFEIQI